MDDKDNQGYVQFWVADQARRAQTDSSENDSHAARLPDHARPWRPLNLPASLQAINKGITCSPRKHGSEAWDKPILGLPSLTEASNGLDPDNYVGKAFNTTHKASISDGRNSGSLVQKEGPFSKRPRRKTHGDRYERDHDKRRKRSHNRDAIQRRDEHPDEASQVEKRKVRPGETVMSNFKSPYIHADEIIMPQLKKGIFDNKIVSKREYVADLDFNHIPLRNKIEPAELEHRQKVREKDERRRMQRAREEAQVFERAFSGSQQPPKAAQESLGLPPSRGQRSSSVHIDDRRHPTRSSCGTLNARDLSERSLIQKSSDIPGPEAQNLTSLSYTGLETSEVESIPQRGSHREPRQVQEHRAMSAVQASIHQNHLQNLIASGIFNFIDRPFEEAKARQRQAVEARPRQDEPDECEDRCTHQPTHKETHEHKRDRPGDGDLTTPERRLRNLENPAHTPLEAPPDWTTALRCEHEVGPMDRKGQSETQPTNSIAEGDEGQRRYSMQGSRHRTDPDPHTRRNVFSSLVPERRQSSTAPPRIPLRYARRNDRARVGKTGHVKSNVSAHQHRIRTQPYESPEMMIQILEEASGQTSPSPHHGRDQQAGWPLDSQRQSKTELSGDNGYGRPFGESLDDLVKRIDDEILGEPLLRQGLRAHGHRGDAGHTTPWTSHDVNELPREDLARFLDDAAPGQPVHHRFSRYDPDFSLDNAEDDSELGKYLAISAFLNAES